MLRVIHYETDVRASQLTQRDNTNENN